MKKLFQQLWNHTLGMVGSTKLLSGLIFVAGLYKLSPYLLVGLTGVNLVNSSLASSPPPIAEVMSRPEPEAASSSRAPKSSQPRLIQLKQLMDICNLAEAVGFVLKLEILYGVEQTLALKRFLIHWLQHSGDSQNEKLAWDCLNQQVYKLRDSDQLLESIGLTEKVRQILGLEGALPKNLIFHPKGQEKYLYPTPYEAFGLYLQHLQNWTTADQAQNIYLLFSAITQDVGTPPEELRPLPDHLHPGKLTQPNPEPEEASNTPATEASTEPEEASNTPATPSVWKSVVKSGIWSTASLSVGMIVRALLFRS